MEKTKSSQRIRVGIICGGKSAEHQISIRSAQNVIAALDTALFEPVLIGIDTAGGWHLLADIHALDTIKTLLPTHDALSAAQAVAALEAEDKRLAVVFPVLHGPQGEDGIMQGFLELAGLPYVGCDVLGSAVGMDKDVMKHLLRDAGIPIADFVTVTTQQNLEEAQAIVARLGLPLFVKPANMGSSVGVSKVSNVEEIQAALTTALQYDTKAVIETAIIGDEVECAVLGNDVPKASVPGRIIPKADFYSYEAKYHDEQGTVLEIPARLSVQLADRIQRTALQTYAVLGSKGLARVDMFVTKDGEIIVNEINTMPGFTRHSMYPQLWEATDLSYSELLTQLITLGIERFNRTRQLQTTYANG